MRGIKSIYWLPILIYFSVVGGAIYLFSSFTDDLFVRGLLYGFWISAFGWWYFGALNKADEEEDIKTFKGIIKKLIERTKETKNFIRKLKAIDKKSILIYLGIIVGGTWLFSASGGERDDLLLIGFYWGISISVFSWIIFRKR